MRDEHTARERRKAWKKWERETPHLQADTRRLEEVFTAGFDAGVAAAAPQGEFSCVNCGQPLPPEPEEAEFREM